MRGMIGEEQGPASSEPKREPTWDSDAESALIDLTASPSPADAGEMEPEVTVTAAPSCPNSPGVAAAASNRRLRGKTPSGDQFDEAAKALIEMRERIAKDVGKKSFQEEAAFPKPGPKVKSEVAASTTPHERGRGRGGRGRGGGRNPKAMAKQKSKEPVAKAQKRSKRVAEATAKVAAVSMLADDDTSADEDDDYNNPEHSPKRRKGGR